MEILFYSLLCFFALYGFAQMAMRLSDYFRTCDESGHSVTTVLTVKNQQDNVEGLVRGAVWSTLGRTGGRRVGDVIVVDLGSDDDTLRILNRLAEEYEFLHIMDRQTYIQSIQKMEG